MDLFGAFSLFALLAVFGVLGLVVLGLAVVFNNRGEVDSTGRRSTAIYLAVVSFVALYTLIISGVAAVASLSSLIIDEDDRRGDSVAFDLEDPFGAGTGAGGGSIPPGVPADDLGDDPELEDLADGCFEGDMEACDAVYFESPIDSGYEAYGETCGGRNEAIPGGCVDRYEGGADFDGSFDGAISTALAGPDPDDEAIRSTVQAGLIAIVAAAVFAFHVRLRRDLVGESDFEGTAAWRADRAFLYVVSAVAVLIALFAAATVVYDVFRLIAPGITSDTSQSLERERALAQIIPMLVLTGATAYVFGRYLSEVSGKPPFGVRPASGDDSAGS